MKSIRLLIVLGLLVITFGCSSISVQYDYDTKTDLTSLKTFNWLSARVQEDIHVLNVERIKDAVSSQLESKGCTMTNDNPDFLIAMHVAKEQKTDVRAWGYSYGARAVYGGSYYLGHQDLDVYQYEEGTFILDFVDAQSRELIWRGVAKGEIRNYANPVKRNERIDEVVQIVLSNFPPTK